jgi:hypothetical protein
VDQLPKPHDVAKGATVLPLGPVPKGFGAKGVLQAFVAKRLLFADQFTPS